MNTITKQFEKIGARASIRKVIPSRNIESEVGLRVNIFRDKHGEFFAIDIYDPNLEFNILQIDPNDKHLLLMVKDFNGLSKYLCGHDERHWFVAGVDQHSVTIDDAKESLKPHGAQISQTHHNVKIKNKHRRKNAGFLRQGEWFFVPVPDFHISSHIIHKKEPIQRGRAKPHIVEELVRSGGTQVYVNSKFPEGLTQEEYAAYIKKHPENRHGWKTFIRDAQVFGRGTVKHSDHKTIILKIWHQILTNREVSLESIAFLD